MKVKCQVRRDLYGPMRMSVAVEAAEEVEDEGEGEGSFFFWDQS